MVNQSSFQPPGLAFLLFLCYEIMVPKLDSLTISLINSISENSRYILNSPVLIQCSEWFPTLVLEKLNNSNKTQGACSLAEAE